MGRSRWNWAETRSLSRCLPLTECRRTRRRCCFHSRKNSRWIHRPGHREGAELMVVATAVDDLSRRIDRHRAATVVATMALVADRPGLDELLQGIADVRSQRDRAALPRNVVVGEHAAARVRRNDQRGVDRADAGAAAVDDRHGDLIAARMGDPCRAGRAGGARGSDRDIAVLGHHRAARVDVHGQFAGAGQRRHGGGSAAVPPPPPQPESKIASRAAAPVIARWFMTVSR